MCGVSGADSNQRAYPPTFPTTNPTTTYARILEAIEETPPGDPLAIHQTVAIADSSVQARYHPAHRR